MAGLALGVLEDTKHPPDDAHGRLLAHESNVRARVAGRLASEQRVVEVGV